MSDHQDNGLPPPEPQGMIYTVLKVGAEGGSYTIVCNGAFSPPVYSRLESTGEFFCDEDDAEGHREHSSESGALGSSNVYKREAFPWVSSLDESLQTINPSWPRLYPLLVNPAHKAEIRAIWEKHASAPNLSWNRHAAAGRRWLELLSDSDQINQPDTESPQSVSVIRPGNRVAPDGSLFDTKARLKLMGNRGILNLKNGQYVTPSGFRPWIQCVIDTSEIPNYKPANVKYTKLFFTDEASALSAGHRPCGYCQRSRMDAFKTAWLSANHALFEGKPKTLGTLDRILHTERFLTSKRPVETILLRELPDGTFYKRNGEIFLVWKGFAVLWSSGLYEKAFALPEQEQVQVLTPPSLVNLYTTGWQPDVHQTALQLIKNMAGSNT